MRYSEARGTQIYEKNVKSKISCQTPFKETWHFHYPRLQITVTGAYGKKVGELVLFAYLNMLILQGTE